MRIGLFPRIVAGLAGVALIPLGLVSVQLIKVNSDAMLTQVLRTHSVAAVATSGRIAAEVEALRTAGASVGGAVARVAHDGSAEILASFLEATPQVVSTALVDGSGREIVRVQRRGLAEGMNTLLDFPLETQPRIMHQGAKNWLLHDVPVDGERLWLRVVADGDPLALSLESEDLGEEARLMVITRSGDVVFGDGKGGGIETFPAALVKAAMSGRVGGAGRYAGSNADVVGAFNPVTGTPWVVLSRQPAEVAEKAATKMKSRARLAVISAVILGALLSLAAYRSLVQPLRGLLDAQRRLAGLRNRPAAGNELEELKENMERLERRAGDKEDLGKVFLGRYQVVEVIGEGAMGSVFRGWDPKLERMVALKTIRLVPLGYDKETLAGHLVREAVTVARFSHPNIVAVYDVEDSPEAAFLAMEFVDGVSLQEHLSRVQRLPPGEATVLGAAIARALGASHQRGLVHHDVKPGNVLLGFDGSIKMADFGIARGISATVDDKSQVFGTPGYLPPEALIGEGYDERGDLFAMGVILYRCLAGRMPYTGNTLQEIFEKTHAGDVEPLDAVSPIVPAELSRLVMALLAPDRDRRPASADSVAETLGHLAEVNGYRWFPPNADAVEEKGGLESDDEVLQSQLVPTISFIFR